MSLKKIIKRLLYAACKPLSFATRRQLAILLLDSIGRSGPEDEASRRDAFASLDVTQVEIEDRIRSIEYSRRRVSSRRTTPILTSVIEDKAPWREIPLEPFAMPGMLQDEEMQYYEYIGRQYEGSGAAIELGPWLGKSTRHILRGLKKVRNSTVGNYTFSMPSFGGKAIWIRQHRSI